MALHGPRGADPAEVAAVVALADDIFAAEARDMGPSFPTLFSAANADWLRTYWDGADCVSHVGIWRGAVVSRGRRLTVAHVGAVCTRPAYRNRGLAAALLGDAMTRLHERGVALLLISGGRGLYQRVGARPFGRLLRYRVPCAALRQLPEARGELPTADQLAALYAREPLHYERSAAEWASLLPAKGFLPPTRGRGALAVRLEAGRSEPDAYVLLGAPREPRGEAQAGPVLPVDEFAGDRRAVLAAVAAAVEAAGARVAELLVQPGDAQLRGLLADLGVSGEVCGQQGTARVLNVPACAAAIGREPPAAAGPLGEAAEAEQAAALTAEWFGPDGVELPRNDGLNYI